MRQIRHEKVLRPVGGGAHRRRLGARAHCGDARWRRPERSGVHSGARCRARGSARRGSGSLPVSASAAKPRDLRNCSRASPTRCATRCLKDGTRDTGCGLKAFRRDLFLSLPYFDGSASFLPALVRREGFAIGYVDVADRPRAHGVELRFLGPAVDRHSRSCRVWWLIRPRQCVPQSKEMTLLVDISHAVGAT